MDVERAAEQGVERDGRPRTAARALTPKRSTDSFAMGRLWNRGHVDGVCAGMRILCFAALGIFVTEPLVLGADGSAPVRDAAASVIGVAKAGEGTRPADVNLIAFIGRRIEAKYVERKPKPNVILLDAEYALRYEVLQVVFGTYPKKEISFSSYVHVGPPAFKKYKYGLIYVSERNGRYVQQKYLFQPVYRTADGRWAGCGDPYAGGMPGSGVKAEPITFKPPVVFDVRDVSEFVLERQFPSPMFRREGTTVVCEMGNYPGELFRVMREGYLTARGVFGPSGR